MCCKSLNIYKGTNWGQKYCNKKIRKTNISLFCPSDLNA